MVLCLTSLHCGPLAAGAYATLASDCNLTLTAFAACADQSLSAPAQDSNLCLSFFATRSADCVEAFGNFAACIDVKGCQKGMLSPCLQSFEATNALCGNFLNVVLAPRAPHGYY